VNKNFFVSIAFGTCITGADTNQYLLYIIYIRY